MTIEAGDDLLGVMFNMYKLVWDKESKPTEWEDTTAISLYKGKGLRSEFNNQRFIHTKQEIPKVFEQLVMEKPNLKS